MFPPALPPATTIDLGLTPSSEALDLHCVWSEFLLIWQVGQNYPFQGIEAVIDRIWKFVRRSHSIVDTGNNSTTFCG